jgi:hypothetical protein
MILYRLRYRPVTSPLPARYRDRPSATVTDRYHTVTIPLPYGNGNGNKSADQ